MSERAHAVLILTHSADFYTVDRVAEELASRGARSVRVDTDLFPTRVRMSARPASQGSVDVLTTETDVVRASDVRAVWMRHLWPPSFLGEEVDPVFVEGCIRESGAAFEGFLDALSHARWINPLAEDRTAANKLLQLRVAREEGLALPRTLVTNDPAALRAFYDETDGRLVAKMLTRLTTAMEKSSFNVPTSEVRAEDLEHGEALRLSPMVFQERIEKDIEFRVAYVDGELFPGAIDASRSTAGRVDWRESDPSEVRWERGELPSETADRLRRFMQRLGLVYGALDLIRTPDGRHVFLEVNPNGEWGMLEHDLGLPIAEAIAKALLAERRRA
jgi:MvdC family ATP-grasp ribosomal peptide maturase